MSSQGILEWIRGLFNLEAYKSREDEVVESIRNNVEFKGSNLWILIFAIIIASIGLNVNSAAVVIGAMLISPIMGPIIGMGLGVGIYDFGLIKKSARNLSVAVVISILTAAIYFLLTPLKDAHSELLARTQPTIWDVFIGFFGGMAGIIATSSKEKGNVIPGAAIATALIPPLCTAGYGLATGNFSYFIGAFYLFIINAVFICLATILIIRYLRFSIYSFVDVQTAKRVKRSITFVVLITIVPSIYLATRLVLKTIYENKLDEFVIQELQFPNTIVASKQINYAERSLTVFLVGDKLDSTITDLVENKLERYGLTDTRLIIKQGREEKKIVQSALDPGLMEDLLRKNRQELDAKDAEIAELKKQNLLYKDYVMPVEDVLLEIQAQEYPVSSISISRSEVYGESRDTLCMAYVELKKPLVKKEKTKLENFLKTRLKSDQIKVLYDK